MGRIEFWREERYEMRMMAKVSLAGLVMGAATSVAVAQGGPAAVRLRVDTTQVVSPVSPLFYGLMTEEINHSYDGGLYAEMVGNRTFRSRRGAAAGWQLVRNAEAKASMEIDTASGPSKALPYSLKLTVQEAGPGNEAGVNNTGYWGMAVRPATTYRGSLYAQAGEKNPGPVTVRLVGDVSGKTLASAIVDVNAGGWAKYEYTLKTGPGVVASAANHLELTVAKPGTLSLQLVSLMPPTYHNRANGNRPDLMEAMAAMTPTFLRLPGGNYLEGDQIADRFEFKDTIGPLVDRPGHQAPWSYWSTDGMGLLEFLEWCEDLRIQPVLAVYAGYSLRGVHVNAGKDLQPYVDDALDEVEYVTGDLTTKWGKQRANDGHPAPFPLTYIEIGNEDWFDKSGSYPARFAQMAAALRKKYPQYKLIATMPVKDMKAGTEPDVVDDHYYKSPAEMFDLVHHYDNEPRTGPKVFVGEWATRSASPTPDFGDALGDAAWMTSMERNADLIVMASYAPLFVNVNPGGMQWATDLIGFDAERWYGSPSYWAQVMFDRSIGDQLPKVTEEGAGARFFYSATVSSATKTLHLKLVNASTAAQGVEVEMPGAGAGAHVAKVSSLHAGSFFATNSITAPNGIKPVASTLRVTGAKMAHTVPALTIEVLDVPLK